MYIYGGFRSGSTSEKSSIAVLVILIFTFILVGYYTATDDIITDTDKVVCIEKHANEDSVTFRFKRERDGKEFQYTINGAEYTTKVFNELNDQIKKDTICEIETNNLDVIKHVNVPIDD